MCVCVCVFVAYLAVLVVVKLDSCLSRSNCLFCVAVASINLLAGVVSYGRC